MKKVIKVKLPKTVKIGYCNYDVSYPFEFIEDKDLAGLHIGAKQAIKVANDRATGKVIETFLHEIFHAIDGVFLGDIFSEETIVKLSKAWLQVIVDSKLNIYSDKLPKTIKIGPFKFKVVADYNFEDMERNISGQVDEENLTIRIKVRDSISAFSEEYTKTIVFMMIQVAILSVYTIEDEIFERLPIKVLSNAVYQVLKENNLEELIKEYM